MESEDFSCFTESFSLSIEAILFIVFTSLAFFLLCYCCVIAPACAPYRTPTRMSAFEPNTLGSIVFSKQLLQEWAEGDQRSNSSSSSRDSSAPQSESIECSICLDSIEEGQRCRRLPVPCGHLFHIGCIDEWLKQSVHCPLCKRSTTQLLMRNDQMTMTTLAMESRGNSNERTHQRFQLPEDNDLEQLVRISDHSEGRLNPYFAPNMFRSATTESDVAATTAMTGYHTIINDMAPNEEYVSALHDRNYSGSSSII